MNISKMTTAEQIKAFQDLAHELQYFGPWSDKMTDDHEEFFMDLANRIVPEMEVALERYEDAQGEKERDYFVGQHMQRMGDVI